MSWIIAPSAFISKLTVQHIICTYLVFLLLLPFIHHCIPSILPSSDFNKFNTIIQYHMHLSLVFLLLLSLKHRNTPSILPFSRFHRLGLLRCLAFGSSQLTLMLYLPLVLRIDTISCLQMQLQVTYKAAVPPSCTNGSHRSSPLRLLCFRDSSLLPLPLCPSSPPDASNKYHGQRQSANLISRGHRLTKCLLLVASTRPF